MREFHRGQKTKIQDLTRSNLLAIGVSASVPSGMTIDISCIGLDGNNRLSDDRYFIFYNRTESPCGSIGITGGSGGDNQGFVVDIEKIPSTIKKLSFVLTLDGQGTMAGLSAGHIRLMAGGEEIVRYRFTGSDFQAEKAIIAAEVYFKDCWRFAAVGQGFAGGLAALLKHFGAEVKEPPTASATPLPPQTPSPPPRIEIPPPQPRVEAPPPQPPRDAPSPASPGVSLKKVVLEKRGDRQAVDLRKGNESNVIHFNLNWHNFAAQKKKGFFGFGKTEEPDLDLGCMLRMQDGQMAVIQPLGGYFGARDAYPFISLDKDDRSGSAQDGENLYIYKPDLISFVMVFAFIYAGAKDFREVGGRLKIKDHKGNEIYVKLDNPDQHRTFCAICTVENTGSSVEITKQELYFSNHLEADKHFGFGFHWEAGRK